MRLEKEFSYEFDLNLQFLLEFRDMALKIRYK